MKEITPGNEISPRKAHTSYHIQLHEVSDRPLQIMRFQLLENFAENFVDCFV